MANDNRGLLAVGTVILLQLKGDKLEFVPYQVVQPIGHIKELEAFAGCLKDSPYLKAKLSLDVWPDADIQITAATAIAIDEHNEIVAKVDIR